MREACKYVRATPRNKEILDKYPSAGPRANITGMRRIWGKDATIVKCGVYIYKVPKDVVSRLD